MRQYLDLLREVLEKGKKRKDRTGVGVLSLFGRQLRFDLQKGFPILTTKKIHFKSVVYELLWFLRGDTNIKYLNEHGVTIWDEWADENGDLGPIYGKQWRAWGGEIDQISNIIEEIKKNPYSRRLVVSAWNVADLPKMALAPCHCLFQFYVDVEHKLLHCQLYQRSGDIFLGVPFNIASYSLFTIMIAQVTNLQPGEFIHTFGDVHLYLNHVEQAKLQLTREPRELPRLWINPDKKNIFDFEYRDFKLIGYNPHPRIKAEVAI